jgi:multimeric flavodoxin WrbA
MKVIGIVGSRRKKGNTFNIVNQVLKSSKENGAEVQLINLSDYKIKPCLGCEGCRDSFNCVINDDFNKIISLIQESDGIVMGSPTYWYNVSGDMKIFLDRCYSLIIFHKTDRSIWVSAFEDQGKWGIPVAVCEQHDESMLGYTYETLKKIMIDLNIRISSGVKGIGCFGADEASKDEKIMNEAKNAGEKLINAIELKKNGNSLIIKD